LHVDKVPHLLRYLEDLEYPDSAAITGTPASLTFAGLENGFANLQSDRIIAGVGGKIGS
jgi:hypothetical protein